MIVSVRWVVEVRQCQSLVGTKERKIALFVLFHCLRYFLVFEKTSCLENMELTEKHFVPSTVGCNVYFLWCLNFCSFQNDKQIRPKAK